jgi:hypothetical protein
VVFAAAGVLATVLTPDTVPTAGAVLTGALVLTGAVVTGDVVVTGGGLVNGGGRIGVEWLETAGEEGAGTAGSCAPAVRLPDEQAPMVATMLTTPAKVAITRQRTDGLT